MVGQRARARTESLADGDCKNKSFKPAGLDCSTRLAKLLTKDNVKKIYVVDRST